MDSVFGSMSDAITWLSNLRFGDVSAWSLMLIAIFVPILFKLFKGAKK